MTKTEIDGVDPLRAGDEVLVTLPAEVRRNGFVVLQDADRTVWTVQRVVEAGGGITVTRPVDHPSRDLPGTVRGGGDGTTVFVKAGLRHFTGREDVVGYVHDRSPNTWWNLFASEECYDDDDVAHYPVIGVTPGTPAWTAANPGR